MGKKRFKIEFDDGLGSKYTVSLDGNVSKEKILQLMEFINTIEAGSEKEVFELPSKDTSFGKLYSLIEERFQLGFFTSSDIQEAYEDTYNEPIKISTISTYLARLAEKGILNRQRSGSTWAYRKVKIKPTHP